jgi:hypothetical protein
MGRDCGLSFAERIRTVVVDEVALETRTKRNYYDADALATMFPPDAAEQMMDETRGMGPGIRGSDGELYRRDRHSGDVVPMTPEDVREGYLHGPEVADVA